MYGTLEYMIRLLLTSCTTFRHTQYTCKYTYKHCTAGGGVVLLLLYISDMIFIEFVLQVVFTLCCVPFCILTRTWEDLRIISYSCM